MVDVTATVQALGDSFISWGTKYILTNLISVPAFSWLGLPIIKSLAEAAIRGVLIVLVRSVVMEAFFMSTAVRTNLKTSLYLAAVNKKRALTGAASEQEYLNAERIEIDYFRELVVLNR